MHATGSVSIQKNYIPDKEERRTRAIWRPVLRTDFAKTGCSDVLHTNWLATEGTENWEYLL